VNFLLVSLFSLPDSTSRFSASLIIQFNKTQLALGGKIMNKTVYKDQVKKRLTYIQMLAEQERYEEIQNLLETNFVLVA
jgi:hypothetical protein